MINRKTVGDKGEKTAVIFLKKRGFSILETNYRTRLGEIDIIACRKNLIAFVEVKTRQSSGYGNPEEAVDKRKRKKIIKTAKYYLVSKNLYDKQDVRFDVLSIKKNRQDADIQYFENAFREER